MENNAKNILSKEKLIVENLLNEPEEIWTSGRGLSDKVARFGGRWKFIIFFMILLFIWIVVNTATPDSIIFDPYPFILMNLILSTLAALQAPIIYDEPKSKRGKRQKEK